MNDATPSPRPPESARSPVASDVPGSPSPACDCAARVDRLERWFEDLVRRLAYQAGIELDVDARSLPAWVVDEAFATNVRLHNEIWGKKTREAARASSVGTVNEKEG
jgi:hypothetical protein